MFDHLKTLCMRGLNGFELARTVVQELTLVIITDYDILDTKISPSKGFSNILLLEQLP